MYQEACKGDFIYIHHVLKFFHIKNCSIFIGMSGAQEPRSILQLEETAKWCWRVIVTESDKNRFINF